MSDDSTTTETTESDLIPPGMTTHQATYASAVEQVTLLADFLVENFPGEIALTNRQQPETPVRTAMRLLTRLSATARPEQQVRCSEPYCNRPAEHGGEHGWIHTSP